MAKDPWIDPFASWILWRTSNPILDFVLQHDNVQYNQQQFLERAVDQDDLARPKNKLRLLQV